MKFNSLEKINSKNIEEVGSINDNLEDQKRSFVFRKASEIFAKAKEYCEKTSKNLKLGVTLLLVMGAIGPVQAEDDMTNFREGVDDVRSGKNKITNVVNSFYDSHKEKTDDSTFCISEITMDGLAGLSRETSGVSFKIENDTGDTISLGNVEAKVFKIKGMDDSHNNKELEEISKSYSAIKINTNEEMKTSSIESSKISGIGKTPEEAVLSAISSAILFKKAMVSMITGSLIETRSTSTESSLDEKDISLSTIESSGTLKEVKVIVKKISDKDLKKECGFSNKSGSEYYRAEVIFK